ncbi:serine/arginine repetitive matrix protein 1-like [Choloepus didactylus]|uniref:serine/arginine repetitive matrix protein 1-like n=1 Tax=Choloepus didactylus TaxID=27675 RepID=UPI00189DA6E1|nr:serine/arginine repetitive matrix protein 1-like [Choloepus didactylus]
MLPPPPPPNRGRRRNTTGWGAEAPRRGPAHANRAGGSRKPRSRNPRRPPAPGRGRGRRAQSLREDSPDRSLRAFHAPRARQCMRGECSPDPPTAESPLSRRSRLGAKMHLPPPGLESCAWRRWRRRPEVLAVPLQAGRRAAKSNVARGSPSSFAASSVSSHPPTAPPPPAAQIPAQSHRPPRCGCCCCCRRPQTRPLQPPLGPISAGGESGFSTLNVTRQPGEPGTGRRDRLIPAPRSSRQGRRGGDGGGEVWEGVGEDASSPGGAAAAVTSPLLPPPPPRRVAESPNQNKRRRLALRAGPLRPRRRLTRRRKTRDGASALGSPAVAAAAAGTLPPGFLHSGPSPPRARPSPPPGPAAAAPARASAQRSGSAPERPPAPAQRLPARHQGRPRPSGLGFPPAVYTRDPRLPPALGYCRMFAGKRSSGGAGPQGRAGGAAVFLGESADWLHHLNTLFTFSVAYFSSCHISTVSIMERREEVQDHGEREDEDGELPITLATYRIHEPP